MPNPVFDREYQAIIETVVDARKSAGLSQRQLARRLGRSQSHVCMIEKRQRRIELLEFCRIARAMNMRPQALLQRIVEAIDDNTPS